MSRTEACGCFPTGRHYPGIAHLLQVRANGCATDFDASSPWHDVPIAMLDTETTGTDAMADRLIEVGIVVGIRGDVVRTHSWLIHPGRPIPKESTAVHGITDADVEGKPAFADVAHEILAALAAAVPAAYNAAFDRGFLLAELERAGIRAADPPPAVRREVDWLDPLTFARELHRNEDSRALGEVATRLGIALDQAHRATADAEAALRVLYAFGKDPRVPRAYGGIVQEQRRLGRLQEEARRLWRKPS